MEGANQVLAVPGVDAGLASDGAGRPSQNVVGSLHHVDAAQHDAGGETGQVAENAPPSDHGGYIRKFDPSSTGGRSRRAGETKLLLPRPPAHGTGMLDTPREGSFQHVTHIKGATVAIVTMNDPRCDDIGHPPAGLVKHAIADYDGIGAGPEFDAPGGGSGGKGAIRCCGPDALAPRARACPSMAFKFSIIGTAVSRRLFGAGVDDDVGLGIDGIRQLGRRSSVPRDPRC
jgi:hypothetical protein